MLSVSILLAGSLLFAQAAENEAAEAAPAAPAVEAPAPKASAPDTSAVVVADRGIDIEADATVTWGVDFGSGTGDADERGQKHGFENKCSWKVKFPIYKKGDITSKSSDSAMYAEVTLKDIELDILSEEDAKHFMLDGKVKKLEGKFVFYGAYLKVYNKPSFKPNFADIWEPLDQSDDYDHDDSEWKFEPGFDGYGFSLGYANEDLMGLDVALKFGSNGNWKSKADIEKVLTNATFVDATNVSADEAKKTYYIEKFYVADGKAIKIWEKEDVEEGDDVSSKTLFVVKENTKGPAIHSKYAIGFDLGMKPLDKLLGIKFSINSTFVKAEDYEFGIGDAYTKDKIVLSLGSEITSEPMDGLKVKLGFDGGMNFTDPNDAEKDGHFAWDVLFDTTYKWVGAGVYAGSENTAYKGTNQKDDNKKIADVALYLKFATKDDKEDASFLMEGLDAGAFFGMYRLASYANRDKDTSKDAQLPLMMKLWGSYKLAIGDSMWVKPFTHIWAETNHKEFADDTKAADQKEYMAVAYDLGVTFSPAEKVEFTAKWAHGKTEDDRYVKLMNMGSGSDAVISTPANHKNHNGTLTIGCKVKY